MSDNKAKRPKVEEGDGGVDTTLADILAEMQDMKSKLSRMDEMQNEIDSIKKRCGTLERSMKILTNENNWEYSAPSIPSSYWTNLGFDEDYVDAMEKFLRTIKIKTCDLRSGSIDGYDGTISLGDNDGGLMLRYDKSLLPHWKEFANALQLYQSQIKVILLISIKNIELPWIVTDLLTPALGGNIISDLSLCNNDISLGMGQRYRTKVAVGAINDNKYMREINWTSNHINNMEDVNYLADAITSHPYITDVCLENCFGEGINGYEALCSLLNGGKIIKMNFARNNIRTGGGTEIPDYIRNAERVRKVDLGIFTSKNPPMMDLNLSNNHLDDNDAVLIARALEQNDSIGWLQLNNNDFTDIGIKALTKVTYDPTSLNSVSDSNHDVYYDEGFLPEGTPENLTKKSINRKMKIYCLLSSRNREGSNVYHLNLELDDEGDDSLGLKLAPKVLNLVHHYYPRDESILPKNIVQLRSYVVGRCQSCLNNKVNLQLVNHNIA